MQYHVQRKINGEWETVATLDWLAAQRATDKLQNEHGANYARMVRRYMKGAVAPGEVYSLEELEAMPTIEQGQADDLKLENEYTKIWLSRCGVEDGEPCNNKVTIEELRRGRWVEVGWYEAV